MRRIPLFLFALIIASALVADGQLRTIQAPVVQTTDTSANSLLVGCATGSTTCTGGIKSGDHIITNAQGQVSSFTISPSAGVIWEIKGSSGKKGYLGLVESGSNAWYVGVDNSDSALYSRPTSVTTNYGSKLSATGTFTVPGTANLSGTADVSLSNGTNPTVTPGADTYLLRVTTTGAATNQITGILGGVAGRQLMICHVSGAQNVQLTHNDASATAADRFFLVANYTLGIDECRVVTYDATSSRWRAGA